MTSGERVNVINKENEVNLWSEDKLQQIKIMARSLICSSERSAGFFSVFFFLPREFGLVLSLLSRQNVAEVILGYFWAWPSEDWQLPTPLRKFPLRAWLLCCEEPLPQEARYRYSGPQDQQNSHDSLHQPPAMWWVILAIPSHSSGQNTHPQPTSYGM